MGAQLEQTGGFNQLQNQMGQYNMPSMFNNKNNNTYSLLNAILGYKESPMDEMIARAQKAATQTNVPTIEQLFPQLAQSQYLAPSQSTQGQAAPVSYGAGRFMSSK
jgi:hypothetical protein